MSAVFQTIASVENLQSAFKSTKRGAAPGDDGLTKDEYSVGLERRLRALAERLLDGSYQQGPILRRYIEKENGGHRPIGVLRIEDKVVQRAILQVLAPRLEAGFSENSFARAGLGRRAACDYVFVEMFRSQWEWWAVLDLADFYGSIRVNDLCNWIDDRLSHPSVFDDRLGTVLRGLIRPVIIEPEGARFTRARGLEQGMPLSPLLANLFLHEALEVPLETAGESAPDFYYARYLDDILIGAATEKDLESIARAVRKQVDEHGLAINEEKSTVSHLHAPGTSVKFLQTTFTRIQLATGTTAWSRDDGL